MPDIDADIIDEGDFISKTASRTWRPLLKNKSEKTNVWPSRRSHHESMEGTHLCDGSTPAHRRINSRYRQMVLARQMMLYEQPRQTGV